MSAAPPPAGLTFDELNVGDRFALGSHRITREEVIEFASKYDPMPFHLDDAAAAANPIFGRLSASGWHAVMILNLLLGRVWQGTAVRALAGGGVEEIRWVAPVYPDDLLTGTVEVISIRPSASRPERGIMTVRTTLDNQHGKEVTRMVVTGIFARDAGDGIEARSAASS